MAARERRDARSVEDLLTAVGTAAGTVAGLAGFVYLVGGLVMWLRFRTADLPADQGVALMAKEQLFVVGLRLMILPLLVTATLAALLADRATSDRSARPVRRAVIAALVLLVGLLIVWGFAVAGWPTGLAVALEAVILTGAACVLALARAHRAESSARLPRWPAIGAAAAAALVLVLCLAVPALRIDDGPGARLAVAAVALLAMLAPTFVLLPNGIVRQAGGWGWRAAAAALVVLATVAVDGIGARIAVLLGALLVVAAAAAARGRLTPRLQRLGRRRRWLPALLLVLLVGLVVPWSFASATWPIGLGLMLGVWVWRKRLLKDAKSTEAREKQRRRLPRSMAAAAVVAAAVVSVGRQLDEPVQLLHATVTFKEAGVPRVEGAYVNASGDAVYIGDVARGTIVAVPRGDVRHVALGPPQERAPSPSLLSHLVPGDRRFSARPLEFWCDGERYGWDEASVACHAHPQLLWLTRLHHRDFDRLGAPVRVRCPREARGVCRGWVLLRSREDYLHGRAGVPRPVIPEPVPFAVGAGKPSEVCLTFTAGQFGLLRGDGREKPVAFDAVVADDREGKTVFDRGYYGLNVGPSRVEPRPLGASHCEPRLRMSAVADGEAVAVTVTARPFARGITPTRVRGAVRLRATNAKGAARRLGRHRLRGGRARLTTTLPPGRWVIRARYTSVAGIDYPQVHARATVTVGRRERPASTETGGADAPSADG